MMPVEPLEQGQKCASLRGLQWRSLRDGFVATLLPVLNQDSECAVTQRQAVARVHHVRRAVSRAPGTRDDRVAGGANPLIGHGAQQLAEDFGGVEAAGPG